MDLIDFRLYAIQLHVCMLQLIESLFLYADFSVWKAAVLLSSTAPAAKLESLIELRL